MFILWMLLLLLLTFEKKKKSALVLRALQESSILTNGIQIKIPTSKKKKKW